MLFLQSDVSAFHRFRPSFALRVGGLFCLLVADLVAQGMPTFRNVGVHDPSIVRVGGQHYVFGSHLAAARSADLMSWTQLPTNPPGGNIITPDPAATFAEAIEWAGASNFWAPDVHQLADGRFYYYYCVTVGDSPRSALGIAVSDAITGPYTHDTILLKSGMWGEVSPDGTIYDATRHPNAVDPHVFGDPLGRLWMVYGSYSGGIFIVRLDPATGRPLAGQGYGKKLIGGNHSRIEAPYILHHPGTGYYYLFLSFGGLDSTGAYQIRVGRSADPDGPYVDPAGNVLTNVSGPRGSFFDDAAIAPYGAKLIGNYRFLHVDGEPRTTSRGYLSPGHNSAFYDAASGRSFLVFHTRFVGRGEQHEVRVHQLYFNAAGWPVVAPHRFAGESPASFTTAQIPGVFKLINHGKDISTTVHESELVTLLANGGVSGASAATSGTWALSGGNFLTLTLGGTIHQGVVSWQWDDDNLVWVPAFSALANSGVSVWGSKVAAPNTAPAIPVLADATVNQGETFLLTVVATDPDFGQTLGYSLTTAPVGATINAATGELSWTPRLADVGRVHDFTVRVVDDGADPGASQRSFQVTVNAVNELRRADLSFTAPGVAGLRDGAGVFTGFTARLPGTGASVPLNDPLLALETAGAGALALTTSQADFNGGAGLAINRSIGLALSSLGYDGGQDFAVTATFRALPAFGTVDQVGLFVGAGGGTLTRAGAIRFGSAPEGYAVHTRNGSDLAGHFGGALTPGDGMSVTISREGGVWRYVVDGVERVPQVASGKNEPAFLDAFADLTVGVFAITPFNTVAKTVRLESFSAVVDLGAPPPTALESWRETHFGRRDATGDAADEADPDADGLPNLLEYALGAEPLAPSPTAQPALQVSDPGLPPSRLRLTFHRIADPALTYAVEAAGAVGGPWLAVWSSSGAANTPGPVTVVDEAVVGSAEVPRRFLRLRVSR